MALTPHQIRKLSVVGLLGPETVRRCYAGEAVRPLTRMRIERAARELGLPLPPVDLVKPRTSTLETKEPARG